MGNIEKFNAIASQYDTVARIETAKIIADTIRVNVADSKEKKVIDYGCGTGLVGMFLLDVFHTILFVDASHNMVEQVKQKIEKAHIQNANVLCCDLSTEYPLDLYADYIIMAQTLLHIKDVESILSRLYEVLNKDGHLLIVDFDKNDDIISDEVHNGFKQTELINIAKKVGFIEAESRNFYHGEKIFMNKDASLFILDASK